MYPCWPRSSPGLLGGGQSGAVVVGRRSEAACASQSRTAIRSPLPTPRRTLPAPGPTPIASLLLLKSRPPRPLAGLLRTERIKGAPLGAGRVRPHPCDGRGDSGRHPSPVVHSSSFCPAFSMLMRSASARPRHPGLGHPSTDAGDHRICRHAACSRSWVPAGNMRFAIGSCDRLRANISRVAGMSRRILKRTTTTIPRHV